MKTPSFEPGVMCLVTRPSWYSESSRGHVVTLERKCFAGDPFPGANHVGAITQGEPAWWCSGGPFVLQNFSGNSKTYEVSWFWESELTPLPGLENEDEVSDEVSKPLEIA